ncbi:DEAD/DEAH box helicase [Acidovorax sp. Be4]|uniref:DEAD/DEAH box helicase n=1 Tax=Acidovorax bellezanensis TaxID=2976702 RepID=A0ABT2PHK6_9BURK|nr:DEAD/DEAH box helicase [Acidovorax sp. Be4]MCT9809675.1 DEAD/DEAH box helicase [Acidovorax sp. Be4]
MPFSSLGLSPALARAASELGFDQPTPIQSQAIPAIVQGRDVWASARTGSGKTAAFALPALLQHQTLALSQRPGGARSVHTLVVVPTRELAAQVGEVLRSLGKDLSQPPKIAVVFGGVSINPQMMALRGGADIVVATPGRLLDLVDQRALRLSQVQLLVLDEADRLLDLGFADELQRTLALLPAQRQTLFFSATFPQEVEALAQSLLRDPVRVDIPTDADESQATILQRAISVDTSRRTQLLRTLLKDPAWTRVLVFVATKHAANIVAEKLYKNGVFATPFHGELSQGARQQVLEEFKAERWQVVVTTDLAARGIDIAQLPVVVNYDLPRSAVDYVHRIGRTGRAGESGLAVSFVTPASEAHWHLIEKRQHLALPREIVPGFEPEEVAPTPVPGAADGNGGVKGKRPSKKDKLRAAAQAAAEGGDAEA